MNNHKINPLPDNVRVDVWYDPDISYNTDLNRVLRSRFYNQEIITLLLKYWTAINTGELRVYSEKDNDHVIILASIQKDCVVYQRYIREDIDKSGFVFDVSYTEFYTSSPTWEQVRDMSYWMIHKD